MTISNKESTAWTSQTGHATMRKRSSLFLCLLSTAEALPRVMGHPVHVNMWRKAEPARGWVRATSSDSGRLSATSCSPGATSATRLRCFPTSPCRVLTRARSCFRRLLSYLHVSAEPVRKMKKKEKPGNQTYRRPRRKGAKSETKERRSSPFATTFSSRMKPWQTRCSDSLVSE